MNDIFVREKQKLFRDLIREGKLIWNTTYPVYDFLHKKVNIRTGIISPICAKGLASEMRFKKPRDMARYLKDLVRNNLIQRFFAFKGNSQQVIVIDQFEISNSSSFGTPKAFHNGIVLADLCYFHNPQNMSENELMLLWDAEKYRGTMTPELTQKLAKLEQKAWERIWKECGKNVERIWKAFGKNMESILPIKNKDLRAAVAMILPWNRHSSAINSPKFRLYSATIKEIKEIEELKELEINKNLSPISPHKFPYKNKKNDKEAYASSLTNPHPLVVTASCASAVVAPNPDIPPVPDELWDAIESPQPSFNPVAIPNHAKPQIKAPERIKPPGFDPFDYLPQEKIDELERINTSYEDPLS